MIFNEIWSENGILIDYNGDKEWKLHGLLHRLDGPACYYDNGFKSWWVAGKRHRTDGPAIEHANGQKEWYYQDEYISCKSQEDFERILKLKALW